jgi:cholesterol oxidase
LSANWDAIVIGSGFGGAVSALRLAEKGLKKVLLLERGRRWEPNTYPRRDATAWLWNQSAPQLLNGWIDVRIFNDMIVAQGAGVGGGSLIYANVSVEAKPDTFDSGWPPEITYQELKPYYERVGSMLKVRTIPENQLTRRYELMRDAAQAIGQPARFRPVPLAVTFDEDWRYDDGDCFSNSRSKKWTNEHGVEQGTCVHCGECDIGCQVRAKNTLDVNYLARAENKLGVEIRELHIAECISTDGRRYTVDFHRIDRERRRLVKGSETTDRLILAAGSLGSTELLLRCRDQHGTLPSVSRFLGHNWSPNGDFLTPATYRNRRISPTQGPTITCAIDFLDGSADGQRIFVEDGGFPNLLRELLGSPGGEQNGGRRVARQWLAHLIHIDDPTAEVMPWFGQAVDAGDGRLYLRRRWFWPWQRTLALDWNIRNSKPTFDAMVNMHKRLSLATGGTPHVPATWELLGNLITPHPLGGCNMGTKPENGVVNHLGEVFGYPRLYVADGAIVPRPIGLNPSRTIAALAERVADRISA